MPTGYTEIIEKGCTFDEYLMRCARAFGATIEMRDAPLDAKLPEKFEPSTYHRDAAAKAARALATAEILTVEEAQRVADAEYEKSLADWKAIEKNRAEIAERYRSMRAKVADWRPPTPEHEDVKRFMLQQIDLCYRPEEKPYSFEPKRESGAAWRARQIRDARDDLNRHERGWEDEQARVAARNAWLAALRASTAGHNEGEGQG